MKSSGKIYCALLLCSLGIISSGSKHKHRGLSSEIKVGVGREQLVFYCIPFTVQTRRPLSVEDVKNRYDFKVEIRHIGADIWYEIDSEVNKLKASGLKASDKRINVRLVCEVILNGELKTTFCYGADRTGIIVDGEVLQSHADDLYSLVRDYIPSRIGERRGTK